MPRRELSHPHQIIGWLVDWGTQLAEPAEMILIGSGALLWHAHQAEKDIPLPEMSMDVDPITFSDAIAELAYESIIGSEFEKTHGWHVNLMPDLALRDLPEGWRDRCSVEVYHKLSLIVPSPQDLLAPKLKRNEPRDRSHHEWAMQIGLIAEEPSS